MAGRVLIKIVYLLVRRLLGLAVLVFRKDLAKDAELLVLRHENAVLRRHAGRVRYEPVDQAWFAALARLLPRGRWTGIFPVTPATLLACHRKTGREKVRHERTMQAWPPTDSAGSEVQIQAVDGRLVRTAIPVPVDDGPGKTVHLWDRTGAQPVLAAGNAAGDIDMLRTARFALVVHHDDDVREYAYDGPQILNAAAADGWTVLSMRDDFARLWPADLAGGAR